MERSTRIRASQIRNILPDDLDATIALGTGMDGYVTSYDEATGKFTWIAQDNTLISSPVSDHLASGITSIFTANENQNFGDICYINSDGEMQLADANGIVSAIVVGMCIDVSISANNLGNYLLHGIARDDTWTWTVGGIIYLSTTGTSGNTLTQVAPSRTNNCIVIIGTATHADRLFFNPSQQGIVEHI